jgi:endonuclease/exonuclease/phosphatase family metal-dependent hydrolase
MKYLVFLTLLLISISCNLFNHSPGIPTVPIIYHTFNGHNKSTGIENYRVFGNLKLSYAPGIKDSCLNLSITAYHRKPIILETKGDIMIDHQSDFSVMIWIKMKTKDNENYGIIGNKSLNTTTERGWLISTTNEGSWQLDFSDGSQQWMYRPSPHRQKINDGNWHQIGFMIDKEEKSARTYFDGKHVGIISLEGLQDFESDYNLHIGCNPGSKDYSMDTFNGFIDEVGVWSKKLTDQHFKNSYEYIKREKLSASAKANETFKVLTWNIWNGGKQQGKVVGLDKICSIIQQSNADIVFLQEEFGSGEYIADKLEFIMYRRSNNLCVLSRFPIEKTYNIYRPLNSGAAKITLDKNQQIIACPVWLSFTPNIRGLLMNEEANNDTIITLEKKSRGSEADFIISELSQFNKSLKNDNLILAGDFNSGSHLDWTAKNKANKYHKIIPFPSTIAFESKGFIDAYRKVWKDESLYHGLTYSPLFKEGYMDRIDFVYYKGNRIVPIEAKVIDSSTSFFPSDHGAVLVTFLRK